MITCDCCERIIKHSEFGFTYWNLPHDKEREKGNDEIYCEVCEVGLYSIDYEADLEAAG